MLLQRALPLPLQAPAAAAEAGAGAAGGGDGEEEGYEAVLAEVRAGAAPPAEAGRRGLLALHAARAITALLREAAPVAAAGAAGDGSATGVGAVNAPAAKVVPGAARLSCVRTTSSSRSPGSSTFSTTTPSCGPPVIWPGPTMCTCR